MSELIVKQIDEKGRITLGKEFAGRQVQINEAATGIELRYVVTVPLEDAWLWENPEALAAVQEGLVDAAAGRLTRNPKAFSDGAKLAETIPDEIEAAEA